MNDDCMRLILEYPKCIVSIYIHGKLCSTEIDAIQRVVDRHEHWMDGYDAVILWLRLNEVFIMDMPIVKFVYGETFVEIDPY